jgi:hypothetical protein
MSKYKESTAEATHIWQKYEKGVDHHNRLNLYSNTETYFDMVEGDQWKNIESGDEKLSSHDFLTGNVKHNTAMIAMNNMAIKYSSLNKDNQEVYQKACDQLNKFAASKWELNKMDSLMWKFVRNSVIAGDSYIFFYNKDLKAQIIDRTNIYLSDEQNPNMQEQKYIIIYERRFVDDIKADAKANGIKPEEIDKIVSDEDTDNLPQAAKEEVKTEDGKCSCLLYIERKDGKIFISRSTQTVVYQEPTEIEGLKLISVVNLIVDEKRASARGVGECKRRLYNQINSNKLLYRREESIKASAFPKPVVNTEMITNPDDAKKIGVVMKMRGMATKISEAFGYVAPQSATSEPKDLQEEYITKSRDLANAGDNYTGNINPEQASGASIIAVKNQQEIPFTAPVAAYKQAVEDIAAIWLDTLIAYNPNGLEINLEAEDGTITTEFIDAEILTTLQAQIRIDVSPANPYSKYAYQQAVDTLVGSPIFDNTPKLQEYCELLEDDSIIPKAKIQDLIDKRNAAMEEQALMQEQSAQTQLEQAMGIIDQLNQELAQGGMPNGQAYTPTA